MKKLNLFSIVCLVIIFTTIIFIFVVNIIEKTNLENDLYGKQKSFIESYSFQELNYEETKKFLLELEQFVSQKYKNPEVIPTLEYHGKDNDNYVLLYSVVDEFQRDNYIKEIRNILLKIEENGKYSIEIEYNKNNEYVIKVYLVSKR